MEPRGTGAKCSSRIDSRKESVCTDEESGKSRDRALGRLDSPCRESRGNSAISPAVTSRESATSQRSRRGQFESAPQAIRGDQGSNVRLTACEVFCPVMQLALISSR